MLLFFWGRLLSICGLHGLSPLIASLELFLCSGEKFLYFFHDQKSHRFVNRPNLHVGIGAMVLLIEKAQATQKRV